MAKQTNTTNQMTATEEFKLAYEGSRGQANDNIAFHIREILQRKDQAVPYTLNAVLAITSVLTKKQMLKARDLVKAIPVK